MGRRRKQEEEAIEEPKGVTRESLQRAFRIAGWTAGVVAIVFVAAAALLEGEVFFSKDARFALHEAGSRAADAGIRIDGLAHASEAAVLKVFAADRGRSISDIDLEKRRETLRTVDWVKDASVRRIWPDQLHVTIEERVPVAFIQVTAGLSGDLAAPIVNRPKLIDSEGVVLSPRGKLPPGLPLLSGVRERDEITRRGTRVKLMLRVLDELKDVREKIGEVDVTDPENIRVLYQSGEQQLVLVLGNERFRQRMATFLDHYDGIRDKLLAKTVLDISLEGQITIMEAGGLGK
ncbi:MAG: FtsQ-type POTRA domain-containing protein [Acidobacteria bacterium]|nr:FtsQ-type POTRA domain-containing protein [Acidobacteriota bacterium]